MAVTTRKSVSLEYTGDVIALIFDVSAHEMAVTPLMGTNPVRCWLTPNVCAVDDGGEAATARRKSVVIANQLHTCTINILIVEPRTFWWQG